MNLGPEFGHQMKNDRPATSSCNPKPSKTSQPNLLLPIADDKQDITAPKSENRGKDHRMLTKTFESKELLPFSQLRTLNQKDLLASLEENDKLGIVIKDQLRVAMIDMGRYEELINALQDYERLLDLMEERDLYEQIKDRLEDTRVVEYKEGRSLLEMAGVHRKG